MVRDTLEPVERIAPIWLDWCEDADGRDLVLDQLAWCIIYLNQNHAGLTLQWLDLQGKQQVLSAQPGELNQVMSRMLSQPAGQRVSAAQLRPGEILLSAGVGGEAVSS